MNAGAAARPVYLETVPDPVFGFLHPAESGPHRELAVLICGPFGWEDVCSYRSRRAWAVTLAEAGFPVLRIDLPGTGDSGGSPCDPDRLAAWVAAVSGAAAWLRLETGCARVAGIGIGLGGLVAHSAAAAGAPLDDLVLWAVPARGRTLLRELRAFAALSAAEYDQPDVPHTRRPPEGLLEVSGFVITAETRQALESLDLRDRPLPQAADRRVLLLERDGMPADQELLLSLREAGVGVSVAPGPGYGAMMVNPLDARPPTEVFERVTDWLRDGPSSDQRAAVPPARAPSSREQIELSAGGARLRETPVFIAQPFGRLFGVLAEPLEAPVTDLCVVLVNAAGVRRIGPNRMWVEIARRWAATGVPTLRLDSEGIGDSDGDGDGDGDRYIDLASLYQAPRIDQARAALDELEARALPGRFVLLGLCAGAHWAFHGLLADDRVSTAWMVNLGAFFWDETLDAVRDARRARAITSRSGWSKLARGEIRLGHVRELARWSLAAPTLIRAHRASTRTDARLDAALDRLRDTGKRAVLILSGNEPVYEELELEGRIERMGSWPNFELRRFPNRDHTFRALWMQHDLHDLLDEVLWRELQGAHVERDLRAPAARAEA